MACVCEAPLDGRDVCRQPASSAGWLLAIIPCCDINGVVMHVSAGRIMYSQRALSTK